MRSNSFRMRALIQGHSGVWIRPYEQFISSTLIINRCCCYHGQ